MPDRIVEESELAKLAKQFRLKANVTRAEAARVCGVARPTVHFAEEEPQRGLHKLRKQIIEKYSDYEVIGPVYLLRKKR